MASRRRAVIPCSGRMSMYTTTTTSSFPFRILSVFPSLRFLRLRTLNRRVELLDAICYRGRVEGCGEFLSLLSVLIFATRLLPPPTPQWLPSIACLPDRRRRRRCRRFLTIGSGFLRCTAPPPQCRRLCSDERLEMNVEFPSIVVVVQ